MPVTIDGTTGITTPAENTAALTVGSITGILKATSGVVAQAVAGTDYLTSTSGGTITLATSQSAVGATNIDFTSIPSWAKQITVNFRTVASQSGVTAAKQIQLGTSSGIVASGYTGTIEGSSLSVGFTYDNSSSSGSIINGSVILTLVDSSTNTWCCFGVTGRSDAAGGFKLAGSVVLPSTLTTVRISSTSGSAPSFSAGTVNIVYQG